MKEPKVLLNSVAQPEKPGVAFGVKETLELIDLLAAFKNAYDKSNEDGVINWTDTAYLVAVVPKLLPAFNGLSLIPDELLDVDLSEADLIIKEVEMKFNVDQEKAKLLIANGIKALYHIKECIKVF